MWAGELTRVHVTCACMARKKGFHPGIAAGSGPGVNAGCEKTKCGKPLSASNHPHPPAPVEELVVEELGHWLGGN